MIECVDRRLGSATLWQLAVPGESDSNFPRERKPQWDNTVVETKSLYMIAAVHQDLLIAFPHDGVPWMPNLRSPLIENPKISKILSFKSGTGLNTALYASASAKTSVFPMSTFLDHSTSFPPDSLPHTKWRVTLVRTLKVMGQYKTSDGFLWWLFMAFFLACEDLGERLDDSFSPACPFYFSKWSARAHQFHHSIPLFHSASWDDCGRMFPDELPVSSFSSVMGSHPMPRQHSQPIPTSLGQGCMRV